MPTLRTSFPAGRYHATPWGHHVNEGLIEWPPSPWRLLRALLASGFNAGIWTELPELAEHLLMKLANVLPTYHLPPTTAAHSRHFMPLGSLSKGKEKTTLVFDTWANVGDGELLIKWDCGLTPEETELLARLANALGYLGRSESWIEAELINDSRLPALEFNAFPCENGQHLGREYEQVSLMAAVPPGEYAKWRQEAIQKVLAEYPLPEGKKKPSAKLTKLREKVIEPYPPELLSCLTKDTVWWQGYGWAQPPGSQRVLYWRPSDSLQVGVPIRRRRRPVEPVTAMLLALTTASGNRAALPSVKRTLPQAEMFHRAIIGRLGKGYPVNCPELTGKDKFGRRLELHHSHAHTLPVDLDGDGHLDHIIVYAKMGLREQAQEAIRSLRRTWTKGGVGDIQLAVAAVGELGILREFPLPLVRQVKRILGPVAGACRWESLTPFVPPRHLKAHGKNTLEGQLKAELISRGLPEPTNVVVSNELTRELRHHVLRRSRGRTTPPVAQGFGIQLIFPKPIEGPLALGYACHFGLGLFAAVPEK